MNLIFERLLRRGIPAYDGGSLGRRNEGWSPVDGTGEAVNALSRDLVRSRARDLERNSDTVCAVIDAFERNVAGTGIKLQAKILAGDEENEALNSEIEALWEEWCDHKTCDVTGQFCFTEMQRMAVRRKLVDGGLLFVMCDSRNKEGSDAVPFRLQIKEVSELDTSVLEHGGNKVVAGIELDSVGRTVAYHFREYDAFGWSGHAVRVTAERVLFLCHKMRSSDVREISPLAKILTRLRDLNQYIEAVSIKERVLACLAVFIKRKIGGWMTGRSAEEPGRARGSPVPHKLSPGMIEELEPGDEVDVVNPSGQASNAGEFVTLLQRSVGAALGLSYEAASRDMSKVNYSSARQGLIDDNKTYRMWQHQLIEHLCKPVYVRFLQCAVLSGRLRIPDFFTNQANYTRCTFIPGGMTWIDPLKEVRANEIALKSCQTTLEEICAGLGKDYRDVLRQRAKEQAMMRELGLEGEEKNHESGKNGTVPPQS